MPVPTLVTPATFTPDTSLASPDVDVKIMKALGITGTIPAFTPMTRNADKKLVIATSGAQAIVGLTVPAHGSGWIEQLGTVMQGVGTDVMIPIYTCAKVYDSAIHWGYIAAANPTTIDTEEKRQACFDLTEVDVIFNTAGF